MRNNEFKERISNVKESWAKEEAKEKQQKEKEQKARIAAEVEQLQREQEANDKRQQLAAAIATNVRREFDPDEKDSLYLEFQDRLISKLAELTGVPLPA